MTILEKITLPTLCLSQNKEEHHIKWDFFLSVLAGLTTRSSIEFQEALDQLKNENGNCLLNEDNITALKHYLDKWNDVINSLQEWNQQCFANLSTLLNKKIELIGNDELFPYTITLLPDDKNLLQKTQITLTIAFDIDPAGLGGYCINNLNTAIISKLLLLEINELKSSCEKAVALLFEKFEKKLQYSCPTEYEIYYKDNTLPKEKIIEQIIADAKLLNVSTASSFLTPELNNMLNQYKAINDLCFSLASNVRDLKDMIAEFYEKKDNIYKDLLKDILIIDKKDTSYAYSFLSTLKSYVPNLSKFSVWRSPETEQTTTDVTLVVKNII